MKKKNNFLAPQRFKAHKEQLAENFKIEKLEEEEEKRVNI
jgi:hypothetical protein